MRLVLCAVCGLAAELSIVTGSSVEAQSIVQPVGVGKPFNNLQDSIALNNYLGLQGYYPGAPDDFSLGIVRTTAAVNAPGNNRADGRSLALATYGPLLSVFGQTYGSTATTFAIPNTAGRAIVGAGQGPSISTNWALGQKKGAATVTLKEENLPPHVHSLPAGGNTSVFGKGVAFDNVQPSIALNYLVRTSGIFATRDSNGTGGGSPVPYLGTIVPWAGSLSNLPEGYTPADGRTLPIATNQALFSVIGTNFGGSGVNDFRLPDLRGRTMIGAGERPRLGDSPASTYGAVVGETLGAETHFTTQGEMPFHTHPITPSGVTGPAGSSFPIDNRQPSLAVTYLIAPNALFPTSDRAENNVYTGDIVAFAGNFVPDGYLLADGRLLQADQYSALYALLGNVYGGVQNVSFRLPDLRARTVIGAGPGAPVGQVTGAAQALLRSSNVRAFTLDDDGNPVYDVGELAGTSDIPLSVDNLGEHGFQNLIPEPSALLLASFAVAGLCGIRARRRFASK